MRGLSLVACAIAALLVVGQLSGNQPERDSVAAAREELGIELDSLRVDVGDVELHVVTAGPADGQPVILLHGFPEFWYAWRGPMAVLAKRGFRVIVPDQRGYNLSDKPAGTEAYRIDRLAGDVFALADALGVERFSLAGHDWGGGVAWHAALLRPERISRFAILDTPHPSAFEGFESEEETVSWFRTYIQLPLLPAYTARLANWWLLASNLRGTSAPGTFPEPVMEQFRSAWDRDGAFHSMGAWYRAERLPPPGRELAVPTLVLVAPDDVFIPGDLTRRSMRFLPAGELRELERGSHWVIQEQPGEIGRMLADWFDPDRAVPLREPAATHGTIRP